MWKKGGQLLKVENWKEVKTAEATRVNSNQGFAFSFLLNGQFL